MIDINELNHMSNADLFDCFDRTVRRVLGYATPAIGNPRPMRWAANKAPIEDRSQTINVWPEESEADGCDGLCQKDEVKFDDILDDVKQVIFNDPATIVVFSDGTKVCVKACAKDKFNKETGLIYALVKRLYANDVDEKTGYLKSRGLGEKIAKVIENANDQKDAERERRRKAKQAKKAKAKQADAAAEKAAKEAIDKVYDEKDKNLDCDSNSKSS